MLIGKTQICNQFCDRSFVSTYTASIGIDFFRCDIRGKDKKRYLLQLWDVCGNNHNYNVSGFYPSDSAVLIVFDVTCKNSFDHALREWLDCILLRIEYVPVILVGNKCDCEEEREVSQERVRTISDELGVRYIEVSAKENINIDLIFRELLESAKNLALLQAVKVVRYV